MTDCDTIMWHVTPKFVPRLSLPAWSTSTEGDVSHYTGRWISEQALHVCFGDNEPTLYQYIMDCSFVFAYPLSD